MSNPSEEENEGMNLNENLFEENNQDSMQYQYKNACFDKYKVNTAKSNKSRSRIKKPTKNFISFDEFLGSS